MDPMKPASLRSVISSEDSLQGEMSLLEVDSSAEVMLLVSPLDPVAEEVERGESFCTEPVACGGGICLHAVSYEGRLPPLGGRIDEAGTTLDAVSSGGDPEDSLEGVKTSFSNSSAEVISVLV